MPFLIGFTIWTIVGWLTAHLYIKRGLKRGEFGEVPPRGATLFFGAMLGPFAPVILRLTRNSRLRHLDINTEEAS